MPLDTLLLLLGLAALGGFWFDSQGARERAMRAAAETCRAQQLQLLDGSVTLRRLRLRRGGGGRLQWLRHYEFDYSADAVDRQHGFIILLGRRIEAVGLAARAHP